MTVLPASKTEGGGKTEASDVGTVDEKKTGRSMKLEMGVLRLSLKMLGSERRRMGKAVALPEAVDPLPATMDAAAAADATVGVVRPSSPLLLLPLPLLPVPMPPLPPLPPPPLLINDDSKWSKC